MIIINDNIKKKQFSVNFKFQRFQFFANFDESDVTVGNLMVMVSRNPSLIFLYLYISYRGH